jgi:hypothetical protein
MVAKLAPPAPRRKSRSLLLSASRNSADEESAGIWKEKDVFERTGKFLILCSLLAVGGIVRVRAVLGRLTIPTCYVGEKERAWEMYLTRQQHVPFDLTRL